MEVGAAGAYLHPLDKKGGGCVMSEAKKFSELSAAATPNGCKAVVLEQTNGLKTIEIGSSGWQIPYIVDCGTCETLINLGYLDQAHKNDTFAYTEAAIRWLMATMGTGLYICKITPNAIGVLIIYLYSQKDSTNMPIYASGLLTLLQETYTVRVWNYNLQLFKINSTLIAS